MIDKVSFWANASIKSWMLFCVIWIIVNEYIDFDEKSLFIVWAVVWTTLVIIPVSMFFLRVVQCFLDDPEVSLITKVVIGLVIIFSFGALLAFVLLKHCLMAALQCFSLRFMLNPRVFNRCGMLRL